MDSRTTFMILIASMLTSITAAIIPYCLTPVWDQLMLRRIQGHRQRMLSLGYTHDQLMSWTRSWGAAMAVVLIGLSLVEMVPIAIALAVLLYAAPGYVLDYLIKRRTMLLRDQMVTASMGLANAAQAGLSLAQGLQKVSLETPMPLAAELNRIVRDHIKGGLPLLDAIVNVRQRLKVDAFSVFSLAIQSAMDRGGRINAALERISHSLQENQRLERKLLAETSAGRAAVLILGLFPMVFLGILAVLSPEGVRLLFRTVWGQIALIVAGGLVFGGVRWAVRILNIDM